MLMLKAHLILMRFRYPIFLIAIFAVAVSTSANQISVGCGQGMIQRAGGGIIIDGYLTYQAGQPTPNDPNQKLTATPTVLVLPKDGPPSITLAKTLKDTTSICFEMATVPGSTCLSLHEIKSLIQPKTPVPVRK